MNGTSTSVLNRELCQTFLLLGTMAAVLGGYLGLALLVLGILR